MHAYTLENVAVYLRIRLIMYDDMHEQRGTYLRMCLRLYGFTYAYVRDT